MDHDTQCLSLGSLVFARLGSMKRENHATIYVYISSDAFFMFLYNDLVLSKELLGQVT